MSDTAPAAKTAKTRSPGQGWTPAADGASVSKTYELGAPGEAVKLAKRALQLAQKGGQTVKIDYSGSNVTVGLTAAGGALADAERRLAKRLDGGKGAAKPAKAAKPEKAARRAAKAAKSTPGEGA